MSQTLLTTADGSLTVHSRQFNSTYHSVYGAAQESRHVFIEHGLKHWLDGRLHAIRIFEMGFGTGLNCFLSWKEARGTANIEYEAVELFPLESALIGMLTTSISPDLGERSFFENMHSCIWEAKEILHEKFSLCKSCTDILVFEPVKPFHLVYFDAFDPVTQPELWTEEVFAKVSDWLLPGGQLLTYCAKGRVKRILRKTGFNVETLPGPPRKREMIRATKIW